VTFEQIYERESRRFWTSQLDERANGFTPSDPVPERLIRNSHIAADFYGAINRSLQNLSQIRLHFEIDRKSP